MNDDLDVRSAAIGTRKRTSTGLGDATVRKMRVRQRDQMLAGGFLLPGVGRHVAVDIGTKCGVSQFDARISEHGDCVTIASLDLKPRQGEGPGARTLRLRQFLDWLLDERMGPSMDIDSGTDAVRRVRIDRGMFRGGPVLSVAYELVHTHSGTYAAQIYGQLQGELISACEARKIPYFGVPVSMAKFAATGNGGAVKSAVRDAVMETFRPWCLRLREPKPLLSEDEADSLSVLMASLMNLR